MNRAPFSPSRSAERTCSIWKLTVHVMGSAAEEREVTTLQCSCSFAFLSCGWSLGSWGWYLLLADHTAEWPWRMEGKVRVGRLIYKGLRVFHGARCWGDTKVLMLVSFAELNKRKWSYYVDGMTGKANIIHLVFYSSVGDQKDIPLNAERTYMAF